ncbi:hypothetical protein UlMin_037794 [Ulmus minor]
METETETETELARRCRNLPESLVEEIISWLPVQYLNQFKLVSKSWKSLINDPTFVSKHLHNRISDNNILSPTCLVFSSSEWFYSLNMYDDEGSSSRMSQVSRYFRLKSEEAFMNLVCHCNGIVCSVFRIDDDRYLFILSNTAIKKRRRLPEPSFLGYLDILGMGLCYDAKAKDYKLIGFAVAWSESVQGYIPKAEMYSLSTDSWREINIDIELESFMYVGREVFSEGVLYWNVWNPDNQILTFNVVDEEFDMFPVPDPLRMVESETLSLGLWNECVVLFSYQIESGAQTSIDIWMMEHYSDGVDDYFAWTNKLTIGPLRDIESPLTFWKSENLIVKRVDGGLTSYNLRTQKLKPLTDDGVAAGMRFEFFYVSSLVSVKGLNQSSSCPQEVQLSDIM